jgi:hypothetical protein
VSRLGRRLRRAARWRSAREDADALRERRVALALELIERFVYDLGLLIGGHRVELDDYVAPATVSRLHDALQPLQSAGSIVRVEFGEYAQVRIEGNVLEHAAPLKSVVEFEDRSARIDEDGNPIVCARRRIRLCLVLDPQLARVLDHRVEYA